jgi:hypothetical protein
MIYLDKRFFVNGLDSRISLDNRFNLTEYIRDLINLYSGSGSGSYTFSNGLNETSGVVRLGGNLTQNTSINNGSFTLNIVGNTILNNGYGTISSNVSLIGNPGVGMTGNFNSAKIGIYEKASVSYPYIVSSYGNDDLKLVFNENNIHISYIGLNGSAGIYLSEGQIIVHGAKNGVYHGISIDQTTNRLRIDTGSATYYLPTTDGSPGQVLTTDGAGNLYWS